MLGFLVVAAQFAMIVRNDPITLEKQAGYMTEDDGTIMGIYCRPGREEIAVHITPRGYYGPPQYAVLWEPKANHRFGRQEKAEEDAWLLEASTMTYVGKSLFNEIKYKASFLDSLAKDDTLHLRYQASPRGAETISIHYEVDVSELRRFVEMCGPKRVITRLREIGSPIAP